jgi:hypothetical protein
LKSFFLLPSFLPTLSFPFLSVLFLLFFHSKNHFFFSNNFQLYYSILKNIIKEIFNINFDLFFSIITELLSKMKCLVFVFLTFLVCFTSAQSIPASEGFTFSLFCISIVWMKQILEIVAALTDFFHATNGQNWTKNDGWLQPNTDPCTWFGVTCVYNPYRHVANL